jgi:hypothetical protein
MYSDIHGKKKLQGKEFEGEGVSRGNVEVSFKRKQLSF